MLDVVTNNKQRQNNVCTLKLGYTFKNYQTVQCFRPVMSSSGTTLLHRPFPSFSADNLLQKFLLSIWQSIMFRFDLLPSTCHLFVLFPLLGNLLRISEEIIWTIDFSTITFTAHSGQRAGLEVAAPKHIVMNVQD